MAVDLHAHTIKSDGSLSPKELVKLAKDINLSAVAITDHDTVDGLDEAILYGKEYDIKVVPGVELSTDYEGKDIHLVGLFIDHKNENFSTKLKDFVDSRVIRNQKMCEKLTNAGIPVKYEDLISHFKESVVTRAHYARYMLEKGYIKSLSEAFERYIGDTSPCFVPREKITPVDGINLILSAGGVPILAHPVLYGMGKDRLNKLVSQLKDAGLVGIEAIYSTYNPGDERDIRALAKEYNLLLSGGSDFHGAAKPGLNLGTGYGKLYIPDDILIDIENYKKSL